MAAAQMALGIEMEKKRKAAQMSAAAVSFFLDHEGHKKFLRTTTSQELQCEYARLQRENKRLQGRIEEQGQVIDNYTHWLQVWKDQHDDLEAEIRRLKGEPDPHAGYNAYGEAIGDSD